MAKTPEEDFLLNEVDDDENEAEDELKIEKECCWCMWTFHDAKFQDIMAKIAALDYQKNLSPFMSF